ncbi:MAG: patatin-like phospholipase family protein [Saprospiraceae bacterium]|nr:patatin-like phospholipase family protein [Saprospiraceae bacterium]
MPLTTDDFTSAAAPVLEKLRARFGKNLPQVSDIRDAQGHQYVNLVQEGGGVLGVALLGYVYVLEEMGIRFMKMAGTSAGAINTMLMTCVGTKEEPKALKVLEHVNKKPLFDFVDGNSTARALVRRLITSKSYFSRLFKLIIASLIAFVVAVPTLAFSFGKGAYDWLLWLSLAVVALSGGFLLYLVVWMLVNRKKFYRSEFGINPGRNFEDWISSILQQYGIWNLNDLRTHIAKVPDGGFQLMRKEESEDLSDLNQPVLEDFLSIVTSDLTNRMKVEFPRMWQLYWHDPEQVNPAFFVRASMAVPFFFRPFVVRDIAPDRVLPAWGQFLGIEDMARIPATTHFVDGGLLSNFPINVFFNPKVAVPRLPTFGIMLSSGENTATAVEYKTLGSFASAMLSTLRAHYDKEFLLKNADFNRTIGRIDVGGINWLNFNISDPEKLELFRRGAEAAARFFMGPDPKAGEEGLESTGGFNWDYYKVQRAELKRMMD